MERSTLQVYLFKFMPLRSRTCFVPQESLLSTSQISGNSVINCLDDAYCTAGPGLSPLTAKFLLWLSDTTTDCLKECRGLLNRCYEKLIAELRLFVILLLNSTLWYHLPRSLQELGKGIRAVWRRKTDTMKLQRLNEHLSTDEYR